jgi:hypothetical protein
VPLDQTIGCRRSHDNKDEPIVDKYAFCINTSPSTTKRIYLAVSLDTVPDGLRVHSVPVFELSESQEKEIWTQTHRDSATKFLDYVIEELRPSLIKCLSYQFSQPTESFEAKESNQWLVLTANTLMQLRKIPKFDFASYRYHVQFRALSIKPDEVKSGRVYPSRDEITHPPCPSSRVRPVISLDPKKKESLRKRLIACPGKVPTPSVTTYFWDGKAFWKESADSRETADDTV